jgi:hypothetical protein
MKLTGVNGRILQQLAQLISTTMLHYYKKAILILHLDFYSPSSQAHQAHYFVLEYILP